MPDLSPDAFARIPGGANRLLGAILREHGPLEISPSTLAGEERAEEEIHLEEDAGGPALRYRVSLRRRETIGARLTRLLVECYDDPNTSHAEDADRILRALGADPDRLAP